MTALAALIVYAPAEGAPDSFSLSATLSPTSLSQTGSTSSITTGNVTVNVTGGTAPYTYQWSQVYNTDFINPLAPNSATTAFRRNSAAPGDFYSAEWACVVTDAVGSVTYTPQLTVNISRT